MGDMRVHSDLIKIIEATPFKQFDVSRDRIRKSPFQRTVLETNLGNGATKLIASLPRRMELRKSFAAQFGEKGRDLLTKWERRLAIHR